jgi:hypothetical protein
MVTIEEAAALLAITPAQPAAQEDSTVHAIVPTEEAASVIALASASKGCKADPVLTIAPVEEAVRALAIALAEDASTQLAIAPQEADMAAHHRASGGGC